MPVTRGKRRVVAAVAVAALAAGGVAVVQSRSDSSAKKPKPSKMASLGRTGSAVDARLGNIDIARTPMSYRVIYRVEDRGPAIGYRTDVVTVRRPWDSRLESRAGRPPGGKVLSSQVATFGQRVTSTGGGEPALLQLGPVIPASDIRVAPALAPALSSGRLIRREVRRVVDRPCQVYRSGDYLSATLITPPLSHDYADTCIDEAGIVLEEVLVAGGVPIARRVAVEVAEDPTIDDATFAATGTAIAPKAGGGLMHKLKDGSSPPGEFLVLDNPPAGFVFRGRYSVIPPQAENFGEDPTREGFRRAEVSDVWENGPDVVVVDQGGTLRGESPFDVDKANATIDLGRFGTGEVRLGAVGVGVRVRLAGGRYLQVRGTLPPEQLAALARSLRSTVGTTLEFAD